jgi:Haem-binding domain/Cytochrome P460
MAMQFIRTGIENHAVTGDFRAPTAIREILRHSCYNCHSNETKLSWYDKIVPVYWQVRDHIVEGRKGLNFSEWDRLSPVDGNAKLWEAVNQVVAGAMPLSEYTLVHRSAKISAADLQLLKDYVQNLPVLGPTDSAKTESLNNQYRQSGSFGRFGNLPTALNGISFIPDYKNWQPVGSTDRYDNGTLRVIVGNDIAIAAIAAHNTNPWPEGTIFGKITWDALKDSMGNLKTGPFKQIEYMIRDSKKYSSTLGWGFARFKTPAMVPYGKTALFASECVGCHRPMKANDFVFTIPLQSVPAELRSQDLRLISSWVNKKDSTQSILYAKDRSAGSGLIVSWKQRPDDHWFGANIPGKLLAVDTVKNISAADLPTNERASVLP